jgi:hypothetical protein
LCGSSEFAGRPEGAGVIDNMLLVLKTLFLLLNGFFYVRLMSLRRAELRGIFSFAFV